MHEMQKTCFWSLGREDPLEEGRATHSSIHVLIIPWIEEPRRLQCIESHRVGPGLASEHTGMQTTHMILLLSEPPFSSITKQHLLIVQRLRANSSLLAYPSASFLFTHIVSPGFYFVFISIFLSACFFSPYGNSDVYLFCWRRNVRQQDRTESLMEKRFRTHHRILWFNNRCFLQHDFNHITINHFFP